MLIILFGLSKEGASKVISIHLYHWHHVFKIQHDFTTSKSSRSSGAIQTVWHHVSRQSLQLHVNFSHPSKLTHIQQIKCNFSHPSKLNVISHIQACNFCYSMVVFLLSHQLHNILSYSEVLKLKSYCSIYYTRLYAHMRAFALTTP